MRNVNLINSLNEVAALETDNSVAWNEAEGVVRSHLGDTRYLSVEAVHDFVMDMMDPGGRVVEIQTAICKPGSTIMNTEDEWYWTVCTLFLEDVRRFHRTSSYGPIDGKDYEDLTMIYPVDGEPTVVNMSYSTFKNLWHKSRCI